MTCGICGSGITADEKFKKIKDGSVNRHIYYGCAKSKDRNCKGGYVNEDDLIKQFEYLIDKIDLNEIGIKEKLKKEVDRFKKFQKILSGAKEEVQTNEIDIKNYAKYLLRDGTILEKRELLLNFKGNLKIKDKQLFLLESIN